jgi:hypothetical protein
MGLIGVVNYMRGNVISGVPGGILISKRPGLFDYRVHQFGEYPHVSVIGWVAEFHPYLTYNRRVFLDWSACLGIQSAPAPEKLDPVLKRIAIHWKDRSNIVFV